MTNTLHWVHNALDVLDFSNAITSSHPSLLSFTPDFSSLIASQTILLSFTPDFSLFVYAVDLPRDSSLNIHAISLLYQVTFLYQLN